MDDERAPLLDFLDAERGHVLDGLSEEQLRQPMRRLPSLTASPAA